MPKVTQIVNGEYIGGDKYKITDVGGGKSKVEFSPDNIIKAGTPVGSEILNEVQNNCLYEVVGTKVTEGQEEIYNCNLEGLDTFTFTSLRLLVSFNLSNTKNNPFLRIGGIKYQLKSKGQNVPIDNIFNNQKSLIEIVRGSGFANFIDSNYVLPPATPTTVGGVKPKVGKGGGSTYNPTTGELIIPLEIKEIITIEDLGLTPPVTMQQLITAMPIFSRFINYIPTEVVSDAPARYGTLNLLKIGVEHLIIDYQEDSGPTQLWRRWIGNSYRGTWLGWRELTTKDIADSTYLKKSELQNAIPQIGECRFFDNPSINPATIWSGTTWSRIASGRNIRGSNSGDSAGSTGGSDTTTINKQNLPNYTLYNESHNHTQNPHSHIVQHSKSEGSGQGATGGTTPSFNGTITTNSISATNTSTSITVTSGGSGVPLNVTNAYYNLHTWKRIS